MKVFDFIKAKRLPHVMRGTKQNVIVICGSSIITDRKEQRKAFRERHVRRFVCEDNSIKIELAC